ncbi:hypothetical protein V2W23_13945, partial [Staphylococcus gallinarum]|uniref:hypothetical protein n=1 Tax=Staphylococcus gallinarum TaxID=1293 RepID=UPI003171DC8D
GHDEAKRKLHRIMDQMRQDSCIRALENLAASEESDILSNALGYFKKNKYLSPKETLIYSTRRSSMT